ncbi:MAG: BBE domain-containing protein, partial [Burkholderiales bacterium]|nr:BBE domain-containing protein [Anaerolineae bacterium]
FGGLYAGSPQEGQKALQPFVDYGTPLVNASGIIPYVAAQQALDAEFADGQRYYWKSLNIMELNEAAIERIVEGARKQVSPYSTTDLWHIGGEVKRVDAKASAFNGRGAAFLVNAEANWHDKADDHANMKWVREFIHDIEPFSDGSRYLNFAGFQEEGDDMMRNGFGKNYARLAAIKRQYDPTNFFRLNPNIKPE